MPSRSALVAVSAAQFAAGLAGQVLALRRRHHFDLPFLTGSPDRVGRDSLWIGSALAAPVWMLAVQGWAVSRLAAGPDEPARRALRLLSAGMVPGYVQERLVRRRLTRGGADPVETPLVVAGLGLAAAMAVLSRPGAVS
ncbi:hypothetical protein JD79_01574 [Geodermatophilus normandii]|uniref:Uncharacterized protein n=1 Tax=Geodermatophilus normandii TaxID=1137989 RepID=A0A317QGL9_9ACTN|nr:hypothetical protein [Geodermatophilus normandii]PWW22422.1 hypothetical protein JD79_01574 [Geodermatophilus normandii]